jgi:hypothetical protein
VREFYYFATILRDTDVPKKKMLLRIFCFHEERVITAFSVYTRFSDQFKKTQQSFGYMLPQSVGQMHWLLSVKEPNGGVIINARLIIKQVQLKRRFKGMG